MLIRRVGKTGITVAEVTVTGVSVVGSKCRGG